MSARMICLCLAVLGALLPACGRAAPMSVTIASAVGGEQIPAWLYRPDGPGPFPAVVIAHDCSGLGPRSSGAPARWADELVGQGYVVLIPDSFTPRGFPSGTCTEPPERARAASGEVSAADAYGALVYLRTLPEVDGRHVGIMGGSHGGWAVLSAMYEPVLASNPLAAAKRNGFAAAVALYPVCGGPYGRWTTTHADGRTGPIVAYAGVYKPLAPVLILVGDRDDWTPAAPCERLAETAQRAGYPVSIKVYAGAAHSFDSTRPPHFDARRNNPNNPSGRGATTGGDPAAWADAKQQVATFFGRYLKNKQ